MFTFKKSLEDKLAKAKETINDINASKNIINPVYYPNEYGEFLDNLFLAERNLSNHDNYEAADENLDIMLYSDYIINNPIYCSMVVEMLEENIHD